MGIHYGKSDFINYGKPSLLLDFARNKSLVDRISGNNLITFARASTGTYVGADGLIKTAAADEARFDHDPVTGESLGLLIEQAGNNYFANSQTLSDWTIDNATLTTNTSETLSPDGSNNALKLTATGSGVIQHDAVIFTGINNYQQSTFSIWLKTASGNGHFQMSIGNITYPGNASTGYLAVFGASVEEYPNGWYRFSVRRNWSTAVGGVTLGIHLNANSGNGGYGVITPQSFEQSGEALYIWGAQWENNQASSITTTYIPTSGSTATRSVDSASITGTNFSSWYNQSEGTLISNYFSKYDSGGYIAYLNDGNNYRIATTDFSSYQGVVIDNGVGQATIDVGTPVTTSTNKIALGYKVNDIGLSLNGVTTAVDANGTIPNVVKLNLGARISDNHINSSINQVIYYPTRLTNTQLQSLTS